MMDGLVIGSDHPRTYCKRLQHHSNMINSIPLKHPTVAFNQCNRKFSMFVKFNGSSRVLKAIGILRSVEITYNFRWNLERHLTLNFALVIVIVRVLPPRERRKRSTRVIFMFLYYDFNEKIMKRWCHRHYLTNPLIIKIRLE